jgi:hypothetical protein
MALSRQLGAVRTDRGDQLGGRDLIAHLACEARNLPSEPNRFSNAQLSNGKFSGVSWKRKDV